MFQAQQKQLIQETNVAVVNIRSTELDYFVNFFSNLGVNAAVGFGLIAGSVSQVPGFDNPTGCWYGFVVLYWVTSALTVVSSLFALITQIYVVVYGSGLALRGPAGSMVKAIDGMVEEQQTIFWSFILTIFFLGLQQIGMYFIMMDSTSAWITGSITAVAMFCWYRYGLRLYNRFHWKQIEIAWKDEEENSKNRKKGPVDDDDIDPITRLQQALAKSQPLSPGTGKEKKDSKKVDKKKRGINLSKKSENDDNSDDGAHISENFELQHLDKETDPDSPAVGFLSIRIPKRRTLFSSLTKSSGGNSESSGEWKRRYFVVQGTSIFYYADRRSYETDSSKPLNPRPIELDGYTMIGGAQVAPYYISLVPADPEDDRKAWKFRCDTLSEFTQWLDIFTSALKKCRSWRNSETAEFIDIAAMRSNPHLAPEINEDSDDD